MPEAATAISVFESASNFPASINADRTAAPTDPPVRP
jgi:hypothetical protein